MTREEMMRVIGDAYAARVSGNVEGIVAAFAPNARFSLNAAPPLPTVAVATEGEGGIRKEMTQLVNAFEFQKLDVVDSVVEGSKAAVRIRFTVRSRTTGGIAVTESLDLFEFRDGKVASYTQFFDTALADRMMTPAKN